ncbi:phage head-tail joining protein [Iodobacter arcticus]|jgi:hypothetical protein|uniref:Phage head-tail joining protein n=1 Tax=Iodobacter arcticus TaxID=590593 RepID=A0ABW2R2X8_9NEIS
MHTQEQLTLLEDALAKGEKRVSFADKTVEYRSVDEIKTAIRLIKADLMAQAVATDLWPRAPRQIRIITRKAS